MSTRRPLSLPITLAVVMIVLLVVLTVGWVLLNVFGAAGQRRGRRRLLGAARRSARRSSLLLMVGVVMYLALSIKAINLTRRQSNFVDSVTHELKSPIASLKLYLQTLDRRQVSEQEQADFYRFMLEDVERLDRLINQVLDAGRLEAGHVDGESRRSTAAPLLRECAEMACVRYRVPPRRCGWKLAALPCRRPQRRSGHDLPQSASTTP